MDMKHLTSLGTMSSTEFLKTYKREISIRKRNLDTRRQVQAAENEKELQALMSMETLVEDLLEIREREENK